MRHRIQTSLLVALCVPLLLGSAQASDHIDGVPSLERNEELDLTDLFVFPAAGEPGRLAIVLDLYPGAADDAGFSAHVFYRIHLRRASLPSASTQPRVQTQHTDAVVIECAVAGVEHGRTAEHGSVRCEARRPEQAAEPIASAQTPLSTVGTDNDAPMSIFAGARADPFFISKDHFLAVTERTATGFAASPPGTGENILARINVLSLALEIDLAAFFADHSEGLYAIAAESFARTENGAEQLDRIGRPEITNLSLHRPSEAEAPLKADYNRQPVFRELPPPLHERFAQRLNDNIGAYDRIDGTRDWSEAALGHLTALLLDDHLLIDPSKPCDESANGYFAIERALLQRRPHSSCGGRHPRNDVMRTLYALYIGGLEADPSAFETGISAPYQGTDKRLLADLPYLAEPHGTGLLDINPIRMLLNHWSKRSQDEP
jgi:hypothetical protein